MCTKGAAIAELFTKAIATTKGFDQNLRKVIVYTKFFYQVTRCILFLDVNKLPISNFWHSGLR